VSSKNLRIVSAGFGVTAAVAMGIMGAAFSTVSSAEPGQAPSGPVPTSEATTGQTVTTTTPPPEPSVSEAKPSVTGPAPLPSEEQGLPG
jgi:hypothetical protein